MAPGTPGTITPTGITNRIAMDRDLHGRASLSIRDLADLRLLQLADSAFPIGALAHSFGLESLVSHGLLKTSDLPDFLGAYLEEAGTMEAVFCRAAFGLTRAGFGGFSTRRWLEINDRLSALKPARESRAGSASLGRNLLVNVLAVGEFPPLAEALKASRESASFVHHSTAFGLASGVLAFDEDRSVLAYLHQSTSSLISACQRLLPLGQTEAMRILWNLKPAITQAASRSFACAIDDACCFMPLLDWGAMEHPALSTRLFIS
jgi:urease accessory protein